VSSARAVGRLAWWGVRRQRLRSLVIVLMLAVPVAAGVTLDVVWSSEHTTVAVATDELAGRASSVIGPQWEFGQGAFESRTVTRLPAGSIPPGDRAVLEVQSTGLLYSADRTSTPQANVVGVDLRTGVFAGTLSVRSGHAPTTTSEVALTESLAGALHVASGSTVDVSGSDLTLRVTGIIANRYQRGAQTAYVLPEIAGPLTSAGPYGAATSSWLVTGPVSLNGEQGRINGAGLQAVPRDQIVADLGGVAGHPLPGTSVPLTDPGLVHGLVGGMIILEVALLAGPAFAIGARRRRHQLATLSVVGARPADLVGVALVDGILLGLVAGVGGLIAGVALSGAIVAGQRTWSSHLPDDLTVHGWAVAGVAALAVVAGLLAAIPSAWRAAARDRAEPGRGGDRRRFLGLRPTSGLGLLAVLIAIGLAGTNLDATSGGPEALFAAAAFGEIGLALLAPEILSLAARFADRSPIWPRLALRDAARQHSAAVPAVAAIIAVVAATTAALVAGASYAAHDRAGYTPYSIVGDAQTPIGAGQQAAATTAVAELRRTLPPSSVVLDLKALATCGTAAHTAHCPGALVQPATITGCPPVHEILQGNSGAEVLGAGLSSEASRSCADRSGDELYLNTDPLNPVVVVADGATGAALVGGSAGTATRAALDEGRAVAFSPGIVGEGRVSLTLGGRYRGTFRLPAVLVDNPGVPSTVATIILPPSLAGRIPVGVAPLTIYVKHAAALPSGTVAAANNDLARLGLDPLAVETGFDDSLNRQLLVVALADLGLTIAAAVTSTALIALDNQADLLILEALGAAARGRRRLAAVRAGLLCLIGALFGAVAGIIPGIGLVWRLRHITTTGPGIPGYPLDLPWLKLAAVTIIAPLVAVAIAALVVRAHPDLTRREER
jgi:putative ABC transport system permease protein